MHILCNSPFIDAFRVRNYYILFFEADDDRVLLCVIAA